MDAEIRIVPDRVPIQTAARIERGFHSTLVAGVGRTGGVAGGERLPNGVCVPAGEASAADTLETVRSNSSAAAR